MEIVLNLSQTEVGLLRALAPRGAARKGSNYLEATAKTLLVAGMQREARLRRINSEQILGIALVEAAERRKEKDVLKFELNLTQNEHQYLLTASSHDKKFRSLQAFAKDCLIRGLNAEAAKDLGQRSRAVAMLVAADLRQRRKS